MCACVGNPKMNPASGQLHNSLLSHTNTEHLVWAATTTNIIFLWAEYRQLQLREPGSCNV